MSAREQEQFTPYHFTGAAAMAVREMEAVQLAETLKSPPPAGTIPPVAQCEIFMPFSLLECSGVAAPIGPLAFSVTSRWQREFNRWRLVSRVLSSRDPFGRVTTYGDVTIPEDGCTRKGNR